MSTIIKSSVKNVGCAYMGTHTVSIFKMGNGKLLLHYYKKPNFKHYVMPLLVQVHKLFFYWEHTLQKNILKTRLQKWSNTNTTFKQFFCCFTERVLKGSLF